VPVKAAMQLLGLLDSDNLRPPLLRMEDKARAGMAAVLREVGLMDDAGGAVTSVGPEAAVSRA
jgi:dihydrodipicolinate synthase/N-acetylneuraminate lyase